MTQKVISPKKSSEKMEEEMKEMKEKMNEMEEKMNETKAMENMEENMEKIKNKEKKIFDKERNRRLNWSEEIENGWGMVGQLTLDEVDRRKEWDEEEIMSRGIFLSSEWSILGMDEDMEWLDEFRQEKWADEESEEERIGLYG
jgi:hypothetical protein